MEDFDVDALLDTIMSEVVEKPTIYSKLGGHDVFVKISTAFYDKLLEIAPTIPSFNVMFICPGATKEKLAQDQYEYLIQRFGGPDLYSQRKGWPAMKLRHAQFEIKKDDAALWMSIMQQSLEEVLGDKFPAEKAEILSALGDQAEDLITTREDGSRVYGPLDRRTYAQQIAELKASYH
eukprot:TRINITY_DN744_c0_g1_i1.p1 TRINITY_DN744_c0_g1~~TRINITY_DN744_c0_g1_i1.p1  ORF type:complete len:178 (-),score=37.97 TRINITY_DN744_c0_g1_i1:51-584(-)